MKKKLYLLMLKTNSLNPTLDGFILRKGSDLFADPLVFCDTRSDISFEIYFSIIINNQKMNVLTATNIHIDGVNYTIE